MNFRILYPSAIGILFFALLIAISNFSAFAVDQEQVIKITAKKFEYSPKEITLKKGVPTILEITALDKLHGFDCPDLNIRADLLQGKVTKIRVTPQKTGSFTFHCDIFCGDGHEDMTGTITVTD